jgi:hypothetical protein
VAFRFGDVVDHRHGLRVVDDDEVVRALELASVEGVVAIEDLPLFLGEPLRIAL